MGANNFAHNKITGCQEKGSRLNLRLNVSYSTWFNRLNGRVGPLFQGRFKAVLHDQEGSALNINRYIHLNPVRVKGLGGHEGRAEPTQPGHLSKG
jgi:putative transposase